MSADTGGTARVGGQQGALRAGLLWPGLPVPISVRKYDGRRRFLVETTVSFAAPEVLILRGAAGRRFVTSDDVRTLPTVSLEYFPVWCWYNVVSFFDGATGALERHFCNIMTPAEWDGATLSYIDLDLDVSVDLDGRATVEDTGDFRRNGRAWRYPPTLRRSAFAAVRDLLALAARGAPPFVADPLPIAEARARAGKVVWVPDAANADWKRAQRQACAEG